MLFEKKTEGTAALAVQLREGGRHPFGALERYVPLRNGEIVPVTINGVVKGQKGAPGELRGYFNTDVPMGTLHANLDQGVYGQLNSGAVEEQKLAGDTV